MYILGAIKQKLKIWEHGCANMDAVKDKPFDTKNTSYSFVLTCNHQLVPTNFGNNYYDIWRIYVNKFKNMKAMVDTSYGCG